MPQNSWVNVLSYIPPLINIKCKLCFRVFTLYSSVPSVQVTLSWWVCFWKEGPTPWSGPCVETASPRPRWETWTHTAWQQHMATGNTGNHTNTHTHTQVPASQRDIPYHSIDPFTHSALVHLPLTKSCSIWGADISVSLSDSRRW